MRYQSLVIETGSSPEDIIANLNKIIQNATPGETVIVDDIENDVKNDVISFKGERPMSEQEQKEWDDKYQAWAANHG